MIRRKLSALALALSIAVLTACGGNAAVTSKVEPGSYMRLADTSFTSIEECEERKQQAGEGVLFNCAQRLRLNDDGTFRIIVTDIAEAGTWVVENSTLILTRNVDGAITRIPINADGTLGDGWTVDPQARAGEG